MGWMMPAAMIGSSLISAFASRGGNKMRKLPTMDPQQQRRFSWAQQNPIENSKLYGAGSDYLQKILSGDPSAFAAFESPLMEQFQQQIVPHIAEQFGGAGAVSSSGLNNALAQGGRSFSNDIAALRANLQQGAAGQALQYAQQPYQNIYSESQIPTFGYAGQGQGQNPFTAFTAPLAMAGGMGLSDWWNQYSQGAPETSNMGRAGASAGAPTPGFKAGAGVY